MGAVAATHAARGAVADDPASFNSHARRHKQSEQKNKENLTKQSEQKEILGAGQV